MSQLTGNITGTNFICSGTTSNITFTGFNGVEPYTFHYSVDGGPTQSITTIGGNSVSLTNTFTNAGTTVYNLISVQDASMNMQSVNYSHAVLVNPLPNVNAGADQTVCLGQAVNLIGSGANTYSWSNGIVNGIPFTLTVGISIFNVTGTDNNGCVASDVVNITVLPPPSPEPVVIDSADADGGAITVNTCNTCSYLWDGAINTPNLTNIQAGIYNLVLEDSNTGCTGSYSYTVPESTITGGSNISATMDIFTPTVCFYAQSSVQFSAMNGTPPYTFTYSVNSGPNQTISTTSSSNSVVLNTIEMLDGLTNYNLISVIDSQSNSLTVLSSGDVFVEQPMFVDIGPDKTICEGTDAVFNVTSNANNTYQWQINGINVSSIFTSQLGVGLYEISVFATSSFGCFGSDNMILNIVPNFVQEPVVVIDSAFCEGGNLTINNPDMSFTYQWTTGQNSGINLVNVPVGSYILNMSNSTTGCSGAFTYNIVQSTLPLSCGEITGFVTYDSDENCQISSGDSPINYRLIVANPGNHTTITDQNGFYSFTLPIGNYTITEVFNSLDFGNFCNPSYSVEILNNEDSIGGNNFFDTLVGTVDFQAGIYVTGVVPGFPFYVYPSYSSINPNSTLINTQAWIVIPQGVSLVTWDYPHTQVNDTIYFNVGNFQNFGSILNFVASNVNLGQLVTFCTGITVQNQEVQVANNVNCMSRIVTGSFDPNDKRTFINGVQNDSTILLTDETLDYVVRFQNTGTGPAQDIYVLDTISPNLDFNTFEFVSTSHNCIVSVLEGKVLKFSFPQIFLPDSNANEPESHGYFHYRIKQNPANVLGDVIKNTAYIYFDFNEAVVTNTTFDSIIELNTESIPEKQLLNFNVYPNPNSGEFTVNLNNNGETYFLQVIDITGKIIYSESTTKEKVKVNLRDKNRGIYFVKIKMADKNLSTKLIVH